MYVSFKKLRGKHISHAIAIVICAIFVVIAVITETKYANKNLSLLNITIAISALMYYLFLYTESTKNDPLTGLFNREMYYADIKRYQKKLNAVIELDMNGLKYLNDNYGHEAGDEGLKVLAYIFANNAKRNMYAYRVGGDEFTILIIAGTEKEIQDYIEVIRYKIAVAGYYCSIGYAIKEGDESLDDMLKRAEKNMYQDKSNFYKKSGIDRRAR